MKCARIGGPVAEGLEPRRLFTGLPAGFSESVVAGGLGTPAAMDVLPDGRVLIATQPGDLKVVKGGALLPAPFVHLPVDSSGERGLLGVAHDPNFAANGFIYLYHTVPAQNGSAAFNEISRFTAAGDVAQPGSEVDILRLSDLSSATNHNGGAIHFGADGMLYVGVGENGNPANSQTLTNLLGKVLRINVSGIAPGDPVNDVQKLIPPDNPFVGVASGINAAIDALGFRNPFTFAVQPGTGTIFVNDVGQSTWEEIDRLVLGGNYGWNLTEGFATSPPSSGLGPGVYQDPLLAYNHSGAPAGGGIGIVGGAFYDPPAGASDPFPAAYAGKYFYQDLGFQWVRVFDPANPGSLADPDTSSSFATNDAPNQVDLAVAPDGGLYQLAQANGGELLKISFGSATQSQPPTPSISIVSGLRGGRFDAGRPVRFRLAASDATDGPEPAARLQYRVDYLTSLDQTPGGIAQPFVDDVTGSAAGTFTPATSGSYELPDVLYRITLTATNSAGATATVVRDIAPNTAKLVVRTAPAGLPVEVDGQTVSTPAMLTSVAGFTHEVVAPAVQTSGGIFGGFVRWSDVGAMAHSIRAKAVGTNLTAVYGATVRIEAEALSLAGYSTESNRAASGGADIALDSISADPRSGTASFAFGGPSGTYHILAAYFDTSDGVSTLSVTLGGAQVATWDLNSATGGPTPGVRARRVRRLGGFQLTTGETIVLAGSSLSPDSARWDYIEFIPAPAR